MRRSPSFLKNFRKLRNFFNIASSNIMSAIKTLGLSKTTRDLRRIKR